MCQFQSESEITSDFLVDYQQPNLKGILAQSFVFNEYLYIAIFLDLESYDKCMKRF